MPDGWSLDPAGLQRGETHPPSESKLGPRELRAGFRHEATRAAAMGGRIGRVESPDFDGAAIVIRIAVSIMGIVIVMRMVIE